MNRRILTILLCALLLSACASFLVYRAVGARVPAGKPQQIAELVVANRDLVVGTLIHEADVKMAGRLGAAPAGAILCIVALLIVGVTGSLAALGDTLFPASSLGSALSADFSATSGWLVRWRWTHPMVAIAAGAFLVWLAVRALRRPTNDAGHWDNRGLAVLVLVLLAAQLVLGVLDVVLLAPVGLQIAHLLGADLLWAALVVLAARMTVEPVEAN